MKPEAIVVNTGPLIALKGIGQLGLLVRLFDRVMVAETVREEMAAHVHKQARICPPIS